MIRSSFLLCVLAFGVSGCAEPQPFVSDYNGDSVKVTIDDVWGVSKGSDAKVVAEANRICGVKSKRAEYASSRQSSDYQMTHLFLCL